MYKPYQLIFVLLMAITTLSFTQNTEVADGWYHIKNYNSETPLTDDEILQQLTADDLIIPVSAIRKMKIVRSPVRPYHQLHFWYDDHYKTLWTNYTEKLTGSFTGFILNGKVISVVLITTIISNGQNSIGGEKKDLKEIMDTLKLAR